MKDKKPTAGMKSGSKPRPAEGVSKSFPVPAATRNPFVRKTGLKKTKEKASMPLQTRNPEQDEAPDDEDPGLLDMMDQVSSLITFLPDVWSDKTNDTPDGLFSRTILTMTTLLPPSPRRRTSKQNLCRKKKNWTTTNSPQCWTMISLRILRRSLPVVPPIEASWKKYPSFMPRAASEEPISPSCPHSETERRPPSWMSLWTRKRFP